MVNFKYWMWESAVPKEYCKLILKDVQDVGFKEASVVHIEQQKDLEVRRAEVYWDKTLNPTGCILQAYINAANATAGWNFCISSLEETQICKYKSENNGFYGWHTDSIPPINGIQRKISAVLLLSDPSDFDGGKLQFKDYEGDEVLPTQGSIVVFPSFVEHRVTPVISGTRYSAVSWASGLAFR